MTINLDQIAQWKLNLPSAQAAEFYDSETRESITLVQRLRQSPINKSKLADTIRVSTTTIALDPDLTIWAEANSRWLVVGDIYILGESTNGDCDFTLTGPSGVGGFFKVDASTTKNAVGAEITQATDTTAVARSIRGIVTVGATAGLIGLGWAQNASHVDDVIIQAGSSLSFSRMANS